MSLLRLFILSALALGFTGVSQGYPGPPSTWTWRQYEDGRFTPYQLAATTDPDGRLRTLFTNRQGFFYVTGNRVHHVIMQSFRPLGTTVLNDFAAADLGNYEGNGREQSLSDAASVEPRRHSVYAVAGPAGTLAYGGSYRRILASDTFGDQFFPSSHYRGDFVPMTGRAVLKSVFDFADYAFSGAEGNLLAVTAAPGAVSNTAELVNRTDGDIRLRYDESSAPGASVSLSRTLSDAAPAGWATGRVITGGSLAITTDRRDFYAFVTSYKLLPGVSFTTEARVFRLRTAGTTSLGGDGETVLDVASVTTSVVASSTIPATLPANNAHKYPTILVTSTGQPKWVSWENSFGGAIHFRSKNAVTGGTTEENTRSIANGYTDPIAVDGGSYFLAASGPTIGLDRLDRLHVAFIPKDIPTAPVLGYTRETATGTFEPAQTLSGLCRGEPALAIGPGDYPYIAYRGYAGGSSNIDKLVVAYPVGLADAYRGDYEDRDKDGRSGLLEFAQGTSDTVADAPLGGGPSISTVAGDTAGTRRPRLSFQVSSAATWISQDQYQIIQGGDTIYIRLGPAYDSNALKTYNVGGFSPVSETTTGSVRQITVADNITIGALFRTGSYRLQVTRIPAAP